MLQAIVVDGMKMKLIPVGEICIISALYSSKQKEPSTGFCSSISKLSLFKFISMKWNKQLNSFLFLIWSTLVFPQDSCDEGNKYQSHKSKKSQFGKSRKRTFSSFLVKKKYPFIKDYLWKQSCQIPRVPLISSPFSSTLGATFFFNPIMAKKSFSTKIYFRI